MSLTLDIFIHLETLGRENWTGDFHACPLNQAGRRQAVRIAEELGAAPIQGIFSSPAVRCRESLEPLAERCGLRIVVLPVLRSAGGFPAPGPTWERPDRPPPTPLGGAFSAGVVVRSLSEIRAQVPDGRAVLCSYGDIIPTVLAFLAGAHDLEMPARVSNRGGVYTITWDGERVSLGSREASPDFPIDVARCAAHNRV
jgi:8-oxo-dGTP diphosphatase